MRNPNWPAMFYKPNDEGEMEHQVFHGPEEVPDGWADSPDKFDENGELTEKPEIPDYEELDNGAGDGEELPVTYADYNEITVEKLKEYLDDEELGYDSSADKKALYVLYKANHKVAEDDITIPEIQAYLNSKEVEFDADDDKASLYQTYSESFEG